LLRSGGQILRRILIFSCGGAGGHKCPPYFLSDKSVRYTSSERDFGSRFEQRLGVGVLGGLGDLFGGAGLDDATALHDGDAGTEVAHDRHGVGDEEVGESEVALQLLEQVDDLSADADVEGGDGFVGHDELGTQGEGAGDADALALPAGELVRVAVACGLVESYGAQQFGYAGTYVELRSTGPFDSAQGRLPRAAVPTWIGGFPVNEQRLGDDVLYAETGIERTEGILKNDLHIAAEAAHFGAAGGEQVVSFELDAAGSGLDEAEDEASEGAFAGTGFADQAESFPGFDGERDVVDGTNFAVGMASEEGFAEGIDFSEIADFDEGHEGMVAVAVVSR
jgi:hypothetical protein